MYVEVAHITLTCHRPPYVLVYVKLVWAGTFKTFLRPRYVKFIERAMCPILCSGPYILVYVVTVGAYNNVVASFCVCNLKWRT